MNFPALLNARDLGGYPTRDGGRTRWRSLLRADDLAQLTPEGLRAVAAFGVESVIDLRWNEEVRGSPNPIPRALGHIRYEQISLLRPSEDQWIVEVSPVPKEMWKCLVLERARDEVLRVFRAIASAPPGPLLFHCVAGKDRTGVVAALLLALADVEAEAIAWDYAKSTERLLDAYLQRYATLDREEILRAVQCPAEGVHNMLAWLEPRGGARGYLEDIGLEEEEIARLRARLRG